MLACFCGGLLELGIALASIFGSGIIGFLAGKLKFKCKKRCCNEKV